MEDQKPASYQVVVTGYGPFMSIKENPSGEIAQLVAKNLPSFFGDQSEVKLLHSAVIVVEKDEVDKEIEIISRKIQANRIANPRDRYLLVHLGVAGSLPHDVLNLETRCFNAKCFENQNSYKAGLRSLIEDQYAVGATYTSPVKLYEIADRSPRKDTHPKLVLSYDPGEYLCNYIL